MLQFAVLKVVTEAALGQAEQPQMDMTWIEFAARNWGLAGVILVAVWWAGNQASKVLGPPILRLMESRSKALDTLADGHKENTEHLKTIDARLDKIEERQQRIAGKISRNCAAKEEPESDDALPEVKR